MKKSTAGLLALAYVYQAALLLGMSYLLLPIYRYTVEIGRTRLGGFTLSKLIVSYLVVTACVSLLRLVSGERFRASRFVMLVQLLMVIMPFCALYALLDYPSWQLAAVAIGFILPISLVRSLKIPHIPGLDHAGRLLVIVIVYLTVLYVYLGLIANGGISRLNFNLAKVYEVRAEAAESSFFLSGYLVRWVAYVFNMAALAFFVDKCRSNRPLSVIGTVAIICLQLFLFGMTNNKSFLFLPFVVVGFMFCLRRMEICRAGILGMIGLWAAFAGLYYVFRVPMMAGLMDRLLVVPAALHSLYLNFFSQHPLGLLQATVGSAFGSTYDENIVFVIARQYWGTMFEPNVGWIGDAYANFGMAGIVAFSLILAVALRVADGLCDSAISPGVPEGVLFGFAFGLTNSALLTSLLTGGFLAAFFCLWVMGSQHRMKPDVMPDGACL